MIEIPRSAAPFFQEYKLENLDPLQDSDLVIERLLAYGNREEIRWLYQTYGKDQLRSWVEKSGANRLPRLRYQLWCFLFNLPINNPLKETQIWPH